MAHPRRARALKDARDHGVQFVTGATLTAIDEQVVSYRVGDDDRVVAADNVIIASGAHGDTTLADALRAAGHEVHLVGDAETVGYIQNAIATGNAVGRAL
jgi:hypothetical protein